MLVKLLDIRLHRQDALQLSRLTSLFPWRIMRKLDQRLFLLGAGKVDGYKPHWGYEHYSVGLFRQ